ncbi:MAG TPA: alginate export family protein [Terriglobia bacterium]|nr:alginate export family protein [Terriglobia bacterium]
MYGLCLIGAFCLGVEGRAQSNQNQTPVVMQDSSSGQPAAASPSAAPAGVTSASYYTGGEGNASPAKEPAHSTATKAKAPPVAAADAGWTPATAINAWLPHWLKLSGEFRNREEGRTGIGFKPGNSDAYGLTRLRIGLDVTLNSWFHGFVQARDSEVLGANPKNVTSSMRDVFDLSQAYVEFRNGEHGWVNLKAGRQELYFGDEHLVGRSNWSNASRSFDAVRLTLGTVAKGEVLDVFAASVVKNYPTSFDEPLAGRNFYGVTLTLTKLIPRATVEPYVYLKSVPSVKGADKIAGNERLYTSGLRWSGTLPHGFDYRARYSIQSGHFANNSIHAWAWYATLGYTIPSRFEPRFSIDYNYASGSRSIGGPVTGTFDLLYPTTHQWQRITDLLGEQNIRDLKPGFDFKPTKKMKVYFEFSNLSLASRYDNLYDSTGAALIKVPKGGALSKDVGREIDVYGTYDINRRLQLGFGIGHLFAGQFLKENSPGSSASYPYGFLNYTF